MRSHIALSLIITSCHKLAGCLGSVLIDQISVASFTVHVNLNHIPSELQHSREGRESSVRSYLASTVQDIIRYTALRLQ